ncbi:uncharacterized protein [Aquarana catesbeiana]|uniref:uncharacterized protein isoform X2 n=1 Tax=Aquarana catesbeiana TaxID=8400 RepID=UPI003CC96B4E
MTFFFCVLVVCIIGLSDGASTVCQRGGRNVTCTDDPQSPTEGHVKEIYLRCATKEIICPVIPSLDNVTIDMKSQELKCGTKKSQEPDQKCEIYYCQIDIPLYISTLYTTPPEVTGKEESLDKNVKTWPSFPRVPDWVRKVGDFFKNLAELANRTELLEWLKKIKEYYTGKEYTNPICEEDDAVITTATTDDGDDNEMLTLKIVLPCLTVLLILAICVFLLWKKIQNLQRNLEIRIAYDQQVQLEKKMGSISDNDLKNNEHVYSRPSHIYQEIPAAQEDLDEILQNPLYTPSGPPSLEQQSGSQGEHPAEGQYSLLQPPTQLQPPDQQ